MGKMTKLLLVIALAVFLGAGGYLLSDYLTAQQAEGDFRELAKIADAPVALASEAVALPDSGVRVQLLTQLWMPDEEYYKLADMVSAINLFVLDDPGFIDKGIGTIKIRVSDWNLEPEEVEALPTPAPGEPPKPKPETLAAGRIVQGHYVQALVRGLGQKPTLSRASMDALVRYIEQYIKEHDVPLDPSLVKVSCELDAGRKRLILPKYMELYEQNSDLIGWIEIEGTIVDYPVMYTPSDSEYYLRKNFDKEYAYSGTPFLDSRDDPDEPSANMIVYAHNMRNGTMFGTIQEYQHESYWKKHPVVKFDLLGDAGEYEVFGMFRSRQYELGEEGFRYYDYIDFGTRERFLDFVAGVKSASYFDTGIEPEWGDQILTLSTCSNHEEKGTFVLVARRIH